MKIRRILLGISIVLFLSLTGYFLKKELTMRRLPVLGDIHNFRLYDTNANAFGRENLEGKIWVADFIFTTCASMCPKMTQNMAGLYKRYQADPNIKFVSFSVHPEYDTPEVLADYAKKYGADTKTWHFLTGARHIIEDLAVNCFKIGSMDQPIFHSSYFVLVDRDARVRGYYDGMNSEAVKKIHEDIALLLRE